MTTKVDHCLECEAPLTAADAGGLCPKCLLKLGLASQFASGSAPGLAAGFAPDGAVIEPFEFGGYRILRLLGKGGMGAVYEAEQLESGRRVAIKVLGQTLNTPEMRQRFYREGQLAAAVRHPNTVAVFGAEDVEGIPLIAMELVTDGTLKDQVKRRGPLPVAEAVDATLQIIDGLEAAHGGGVLHRDIKPANCFVAGGGAVKVGDFGLSISTLVKAEAQLTQAGTVLGTPAFASPEQLRAEEIDVRSDIYSVGATLYFLLTGKPTHDAETLVALIAAVLERTPAEPRQLRGELPRELSNTVMQCLAKNPAGRFQSYAELRHALLPFSSAAPVPAPLGQRFIAGLLDTLIAFLPSIIALCVIGFDLEGLLLSERTAIAMLWFSGFLLWELLVVSVPEGLWGAGLGKAICGLRVVRVHAGRPGLLRGIGRGMIFNLVPRLALVISWFIYSADEVRRAILLSDFVLSDWLMPLLLLSLFVTMRRRNGFATVHDLATGTRVVLQPAHPAREALPLGGSEPPPQGRERIGPFTVTQRGADLALACDPVLRRRVWIRPAAAGAPAVDALRRDLHRRSRLRWLNGRRSQEQNWDAFEAPDGAPLTAYLDRGQPWSRVRGWLLDVAEELSAGLDDGTLPPEIGLDRVLLTRDGHAVLLEFRAPGADERPVRAIRDQAEAQAFLDEIASAALQPRVPLHARELLATVHERRFESVALAAGNLHAAMLKPARVSFRQRLLSVAIPALLALTGALLFAYSYSFEIRNFDRMWEAEYGERQSFRRGWACLERICRISMKRSSHCRS